MTSRQICRQVWYAATLLIVWGCSGGAATILGTDAADVPAGVDLWEPVDSASADTGSDLWPDEESQPDLVFPDGIPEVDVGPEMGEAGWPCDSDSDCVSGFCVPTPGGDQCTIQCTEECPFGWECALHQASLPDELFICVPPNVVLCKPCNMNPDCLSGGADVGASCVAYGDTGSFCATPCSEESLCAPPYVCLEGMDATGLDVNVCVLESPDCPCLPMFADEGAWTTCWNSNDAGSCEGTRECMADGLTPCDATVPMLESCNGEDDDCDGAVDEDTSGEECTVENEFGTCQGQTICMGGVPVCDAADPEPEDCDGQDNNCNGETDEGFPDTDGDGIMDCMEVDKDGDDVADGADNCEYVHNPLQEDFDLDGMGDLCDPDDDDDKVGDADDCAPLDSDIFPGADEECNGLDDNCDGLKDEGFPDLDADLIPDCVDNDDDNDGFADEGDCGPQNPAINPEAPELCDNLDNNCDGQVDEDFDDLDGDGLADCMDDDKDGDNISDGADNCPSLANPEQEDLDLDGMGDACDTDLDGDGVPNPLDNCSLLFNPPQLDQDGDGSGNACDDDDDGDEIADGEDNCPMTENPGQEDLDQDETGNACDDDDDNDTVPDDGDNCPMTENPGQEDADNDGIGDACEDDLDGDLVPDSEDNCPLVPNVDQVDCDHDDAGAACDDDDDNDGIGDDVDNCLCLDNSQQEDLDEDDLGDACDTEMDGDGIANGLDNCPSNFNPQQQDLDQDGKGNLCDDDDDNDGVLDPKDNCPEVANPAQEDMDEDEIGDLCDDDLDGDGDLNNSDCAPANPQISHLAEEDCDGVDNNCTLGIDEGFADTDLDGFKDCVDLDDDGDADPDESDCEPLDPDVNHDAIESCNGVDDNCDQQVDNGLGSTTCGLGICLHTVSNCLDGTPQLCNPVEGAVAEECDGLDNNCNGLIDDGTGITTCGVGPCQHTILDCLDGEPQLCDPLEGATDEICDNIDNDCNGAADDGLGTTACGLGACFKTVANCLDGQEQLCDPDAGASDELCDTIDNNCDGQVDEELGTTTCGLGPCEHTVDNCQDGLPAVCDPLEGAVDELCDGIDNNCDGEVDEGQPDSDNDGTKDCLDDDDDNDGLPDNLDGWPTDPDKAEGPTGGSGVNGELTVSGTHYVDEHRYVLSQGFSASDTQLVLTGVGDELAEGDELLVWLQKKADAGQRQFVYVVGQEGDGNVTVAVAPPLKFDADPGTAHVLVMRVPQYQAVTVENGGVITAHPFGNGAPGGGVVFRSKTTTVIEAGGSISCNSLGFAGAPSITGNGSSPYQGDSYGSAPASGNSSANLGGGGAYPTRGDHGDSGGGGGYGTAGAWGTEYGGANVCEGGHTYGDAELLAWHLGSGGGGGSPDAEGDGSAGGNKTGTGGQGAGLAAVYAGQSIGVAGSINCNGASGGAASSGGGEVGGGGGGSGGTILLAAPDIQLGTGQVTASGGAGGSSAWHDGKPYGSAFGGAGGAGRIRLDYSTLNGADWPDGDEGLTAPAAFEGEL